MRSLVQNVEGAWPPRLPCSPVLILLMCLLDLRSSATSKSLVNPVRYVPPNGSPCAFLDPLHKAAWLRFFMSERSVLSSNFRFRVDDTEFSLTPSLLDD